MNALQSNTLLQGGRYKIVKFLGQGGFGITYLAIQDGLERKVAIKEFFIKELCNRDESTSHVTIGTEGSRDTINRFREKFLKEARNIAKLNHPNIIRIIDVFEENHTAYYVMEYAENGSLADKVNKQGYLTEPVATHYILQVANALGYIHQQKMNHLDVKPANIMLNEKDEPILVDFGLSKQYDTTTGNQTSTTPVGISEGYAPMEQYKQGGVGTFSPETDIYSLGATFFKLLTGTTPPSASDIYEDGIPVEELKAKGISQKAIRVICSAMEARKKDRMHDVKAFIERLQDTTTPLKTDKTTNRPTRTNVEKTEETALVAEDNKNKVVHLHKEIERQKREEIELRERAKHIKLESRSPWEPISVIISLINGLIISSYTFDKEFVFINKTLNSVLMDSPITELFITGFILMVTMIAYVLISIYLINMTINPKKRTQNNIQQWQVCHANDPVCKYL